MPIAANRAAGAGAGRYRVAGLYDALIDEAVRAAERGDPRLMSGDYTPGLSDAERAKLNAASPVTRAARRWLDRLSRGEPVEIPAGSGGGHPSNLPPAIANDLAARLRVYADERVEVVN
jgi:hypothetical protein